MKRSNCNDDEIKEEIPNEASTAERRKFIKTGFAATAIVAGESLMTAISYLHDIFCSSDDNAEDL